MASHCKGDIVLIQDADLEYDPNEYRCTNLSLMACRCGLGPGFKCRDIVFFLLHLSAINATLLSMFSNHNLTDMETGYKVFKDRLC